MGSAFAYAGASRNAVERISEQPIVNADSVPGYGPIFNAGVIHHDGRFHLFARGVRAGYRRNQGPGDLFLDYISDVLVFTSSDGSRYEFQQVLASASPDGVHSYEDPRVQRVSSGGAERVVMSYTNLPALESGLPWRVGVHRLAYKDGRFNLNRDSGRRSRPRRHQGQGRRDLHPPRRPRRPDPPAAPQHAARPLRLTRRVLEPATRLLGRAPTRARAAHAHPARRRSAQRRRRRATGRNRGRPAALLPRAGGRRPLHDQGALLDDETGRVKSLLPDPIMCPELRWERVGDIDNIIFVQGATPRPDGTIYLTYGAADRCVGAATVAATELQQALRAAV